MRAAANSRPGWNKSCRSPKTTLAALKSRRGICQNSFARCRGTRQSSRISEHRQLVPGVEWTWVDPDFSDFRVDFLAEKPPMTGIFVIERRYRIGAGEKRSSRPKCRQ